jgi:DNA-binding NarL/FixJ family response regulator
MSPDARQRIHRPSTARPVREILREHPAMGVIVLTMYGEDVYLSQALTAGARGYLLKEADADVVVDAIRTVAAGQAHLDPSRTTRVLQQVRRRGERASAQPSGLDGLTARERDLLRLLASGRSNKEIARELHLAESTVKNRLREVFEKLDVKDRTQAAVYAVSHGLLTAPASSDSQV